MFGQLVTAHRRRLGLTQEELAAATGTSVRGIREIESGRVRVPRQATVRLLADAFGLQGAERGRFLDQVHDEPSPAGPPVPAQLPADAPEFTGRVAQLAELDKLLDDPPSTVVISAIVGTAGVGKTALAVRWAHRVRERFPDGQLYVNLRGFDPGGRVNVAATVLRGFLEALGVPATRFPADFDAQVGLYRSVLAGKRVLVVLDNARDAAQVRPLLPAGSSSLAVVTSRNQLTGLVATHGAYNLTLDLLSAVEARDLLGRRLGADRVASEPDAVARIITATARLPLALAVTAARAARTGFRLDTIATELADAGRRLDALETGDPASQIRAVFSWSYQALSPAAAHLFRQFGLPRGPDISTAAAAALTGHPLAETRRLLAELSMANLVTERTPGRFTCHDLLRAYAADLAGGDDRQAALARLLDHYTHSAHAANRILAPHREPIPVPLAPPAAGAVPESFAGYQEAFDWLAVEYPALEAAVHQADEAGFHAHAWQLAWSLNTFLNRQGRWHEQVTTWQIAFRAVDRLGDDAIRSYSHRMLANAFTLLGQLDGARTHLQDALRLDVEAGDLLGEAYTRQNLSILCERQGRHEQALEHDRRALDLYRATGQRRGQATTLNMLGWTLSLLGQHERALEHCGEALSLLQELGDRLAEANTWDSLGHAHHNLGHHARAAGCYQQAVTMFRELGDRYNEAVSLANLAETRHATGAADAAADAWREALAILTDLDHPDGDPIRERLRQLEGNGPATRAGVTPP